MCESRYELCLSLFLIDIVLISNLFSFLFYRLQYSPAQLSLRCPYKAPYIITVTFLEKNKILESFTFITTQISVVLLIS